MFPMNNDQGEVCRKFRFLEHADQSGNVRKTCRYFGIDRSSFYRWRDAYRNQGEAGLINIADLFRIGENTLLTGYVAEGSTIHLKDSFG